MIVAQYVVKFLEEIGVTHLFGIPGFACAPIYSFLPNSSITQILAKHEEGAAFMAYGVGLSGKGVGACICTSGAAPLHFFTGIAAAYANYVPMIAITGQVHRCKYGKNGFQEMSGLSPRRPDINKMLAETTIFSHEIQNAEEVPQVLARAYQAYKSTLAGPVHISIPVDILKQDFIPSKWQEHCSQIPAESILSEELISEFCYLLSNARAPLILFGRGCRLAKQEIEKLIERWDIPFCTSLQGKGLVPHDSPWNMGVVGTMGSPRANTWIKECDVLLVIGSSLNEFTTSTYTNLPNSGTIIIRVDANESISNSHIPAHLTIQANAQEFINKLSSCDLEINRSFENRVREIVATKPFSVTILKNSSTTAVGVAPMDIIALLEEHAPSNTIFLADAGNHAAWASHCLKLKGQQEFHIDVNGGCMGLGIVSSIGLKVSNANTPVVCICGDGGMLMQGNEISTASEFNIPVIWIIFNDMKLGMVQQGIYEEFGVKPDYSYKNINLKEWAKSLGASVFRVTKAEQLAEVFQDIFSNNSSTGPIVIDILLDDAYLPNFFPRAKRSAENEQIFYALQQAQ